MSVESAVLRKQGRVDIENTAAPLLDEPGRENTHEAGEGEGADFMALQRTVHLAVELLLADALALKGPGLKSSLACPFEASSIGPVRGDERDLVAARLLDERAHIAPTAGDED